MGLAKHPEGDANGAVPVLNPTVSDEERNPRMTCGSCGRPIRRFQKRLVPMSGGEITHLDCPPLVDEELSGEEELDHVDHD